MMCRELRADVCGFSIRVSITRLDEGINVLIVGGVKTHIGAVSCAAPGENPLTVQRPGHRDAAVSDLWARRLSGALNGPVCVECGIHYDNAAKAQIDEIMDACDGLLRKAAAIYESSD